MNKKLPELGTLLKLQETQDPLFSCKQLGTVKAKNSEYPILGFYLGNQERKDLPTLGLFGGVHGIEKVGTHVVISYLQHVITKLSWDQEFRKSMESFRVVSIPLINPFGMAHNQRSNHRGVDLMRNAPVECTGPTSWPVSGHRISPSIPWFRGELGAPMEIEAQILCDFVKNEMFPSPFAMALDVHSGFGLKDRLWYPYAKSTEEFPYKYQVFKFKELLDKTLPHHVYTLEPQSLNYLTHGDLWDYLFDEGQQIRPNIFIPLTLELGSWIWVKKNPMQIFSSDGLFNPLKKHRYNRTMRRHLGMINFMVQAIKNHTIWCRSGAV